MPSREVTIIASVTARAPAKVNLQLSVGALRRDGFHDLVTVFQAVSLFDEVTATAVPVGNGVTVRVSGVSACEVPVDERNLAVKAAVLLAEHVRVRPDVRLDVSKRIPVAGGMAGGSADAAAALVACDALWHCGLDRAELAELAARLGSDVPFSLSGGTAVATGRGERLTPALTSGEYLWVLATSHEGLSTPEVYRECDRLRQGTISLQPRASEDLLVALRHGDARALGNHLVNDLQQAACSLRPGLADVVTAGAGAGALGALVSGSGPTCVFLVADDTSASSVSKALSALPGVAGTLRATAPVPGARVVGEP